MLCKLKDYLQARYIGTDIIPLSVPSDLSQSSLEYAVDTLERHIPEGVHIYDSLTISGELVGTAFSIIPPCDLHIVSIDKELEHDAWYYGRCIQKDNGTYSSVIIYSEGA